MNFKKLAATSALALTLGYSGAALAEDTIEEIATLENGTSATFYMALDKSECELALWSGPYRVIDGKYFHNDLKSMRLVDLNCDNTVDEIRILRSIPGFIFREDSISRTDASYKPTFDKATRRYLETLNKYGLRKKAEEQLRHGSMQKIESELENFFKMSSQKSSFL